MKKEKLRIARLTKNLTQKEVGTYLGICSQEYSKIEGGHREPTFPQAKLLMKLLNININML